MPSSLVITVTLALALVIRHPEYLYSIGTVKHGVDCDGGVEMNTCVALKL